MSMGYTPIIGPNGVVCPTRPKLDLTKAAGTDEFARSKAWHPDEFEKRRRIAQSRRSRAEALDDQNCGIATEAPGLKDRGGGAMEQLIA